MNTKHIMLIISLFISLIFSSCEQKTEFDGVACLDVQDKENLVINKEIKFVNCSKDADHFLWDFGNGDVSLEKEPTYKYSNSGTYTVSILAREKEIIDLDGNGRLNIMDYDEHDIYAGMAKMVITVGDAN